jgi:cell division protein FtsI (penicillin-binding protein 3)
MATVHGPSAQGPARPAIAGEVNAALVDVFQPGSTMKAVTIAQAIDLGLVGPQTPFEVPNVYQVGTHPYTDVHREKADERWSTADILRESSNVGTIKIAQSMTKEQLDAGIRKFGFGQKTTIDFPAQPNGFILPVDEYWDTGLASSAIGTAEGVTAMQMVDVYATLGKGGTSVNPRLVGATIDADGTRHENTVAAGKRVVSDATATTMNNMMREVVRTGTGACASIEGYSVAGKTGTAAQALQTGGWSDTTFASFAGFAPAENPRFAAIVVLDAPQTTQFGARAAAPAWAEIMRAALMQYRVAPTDTGNATQFAAAQATAQGDAMNCSVPHGDALQQVLADQAAAAAAAAQAAQAASDPATDPATGAATGGDATAPTTLPADTSPSE